jgi:hypothetical protein
MRSSLLEDQGIEVDTRAHALTLHGQWLVARRLDSPKIICESLQRAITFAEHNNVHTGVVHASTGGSLLEQAQVALARFADEQVRLIDEKETSLDFAHTKQLRDNARKEYATLMALENKSARQRQRINVG